MCRHSSCLLKNSQSIFAADMCNLAVNFTIIMKFPSPNLINGCLLILLELAIFSSSMNCEKWKD